MNLYNLFYQTGEKIVEKKNISKKEVQNFLDNLQKENESTLRVTQVKNKDDEER